MREESPDVGAYWSQAPEHLLALLHSTADGLVTTDAQRRLGEFGPNVLKAKSKTTAQGLFLSQFKSPIVLILLFATGVSAVTQEWVDAVIILAIVLAIFGAGKLSSLGGALGKGVKDFRSAMGDGDKNTGEDGGSSDPKAAKVAEPTVTSQEGSDQQA